MQTHSGEKRTPINHKLIYVIFSSHTSVHKFFFFIGYTCTHCDRKFSHKGTLNKHLTIHVGDNIYSCEQCGMGFRLPMDFRRHTFEHYKEDKEKSSEKGETTISDAAIEKI